MFEGKYFESQDAVASERTTISLFTKSLPDGNTIEDLMHSQFELFEDMSYEKIMLMNYNFLYLFWY